MKVRQFLKSVYPLSGNYGFTAVMGEEGYISAINYALSYIYSYKSHRRNRQIRTAAVFKAGEDGEFEGLTDRPIVEVNNFWCGEKVECIEEYRLKCLDKECCPGCPPSAPCDCTTQCGKVNMVLNMIPVGPGSLLDYGQYKISGGKDNMGGMFGNYVQGKMPRGLCCECTNCKQVYMTYLSWFNPVCHPNDDIMLPDPYFPALAFIVTAFTIQRYITFRANDDVVYLQMADRILEHLDGLQNNIPSFIKVNT